MASADTKSVTMIETRRRSLAKAMSWRVTATVSTIIISYFVIGDVDVALTIGFFEFVAKMGIYYVHERAWLTIKFGRIESQDYQI